MKRKAYNKICKILQRLLLQQNYYKEWEYMNSDITHLLAIEYSHFAQISLIDCL